MYATSELGEVRIMVCRSMLASDSGEMDSALFLLSRGVSRGLEKRDTAQRGPIKVSEKVRDLLFPVNDQCSKCNPVQFLFCSVFGPLWDLLLKRWIPDEAFLILKC